MLFTDKPREVRLQLPQELLDQFEAYKKIVKRKSGRVPSYSQLIASIFMYDFKEKIEQYFAEMDNQTSIEEAAHDRQKGAEEIHSTLEEVARLAKG